MWNKDKIDKETLQINDTATRKNVQLFYYNLLHHFFFSLKELT